MGVVCLWGCFIPTEPEQQKLALILIKFSSPGRPLQAATWQKRSEPACKHKNRRNLIEDPWKIPGAWRSMETLHLISLVWATYSDTCPRGVDFHQDVGEEVLLFSLKMDMLPNVQLIWHLGELDRRRALYQSLCHCCSTEGQQVLCLGEVLWAK